MLLPILQIKVMHEKTLLTIYETFSMCITWKLAAILTKLGAYHNLAYSSRWYTLLVPCPWTCSYTISSFWDISYSLGRKKSTVVTSMLSIRGSSYTWDPGTVALFARPMHRPWSSLEILASAPRPSRVTSIMQITKRAWSLLICLSQSQLPQGRFLYLKQAYVVGHRLVVVIILNRENIWVCLCHNACFAVVPMSLFIDWLW
jgi:hypothetical protein